MKPIIHPADYYRRILAAQSHALKGLDGPVAIIKLNRDQQVPEDKGSAGHWYYVIAGAVRRSTIRTDGRRQIVAWIVDDLPVPARLLQRRVDAMVGDTEETDLATGRTDAFGHGGALVKIGRKQPGDVDQRQRGGFEMAGAKGFVHGSILLCRPRNGDRRAQYPARRLYSKAENIEHADAVSATAVDAFSRGNLLRCGA